MSRPNGAHARGQTQAGASRTFRTTTATRPACARTIEGSSAANRRGRDWCVPSVTLASIVPTNRNWSPARRDTVRGAVSAEQAGPSELASARVRSSRLVTVRRSSGDGSSGSGMRNGCRLQRQPFGGCRGLETAVLHRPGVPGDVVDRCGAGDHIGELRVREGHDGCLGQPVEVAAGPDRERYQRRAPSIVRRRASSSAPAAIRGRTRTAPVYQAPADHEVPGRRGRRFKSGPPDGCRRACSQVLRASGPKALASGSS